MALALLPYGHGAIMSKRSHHTTPSLPHPDVLGIPDAMLSKANVLALTGVGDNALNERIKAGSFPPPDLYAGPRPLWSVRTYLAWKTGASLEELDRRCAEIRQQLKDCAPHQRPALERAARHLLIQRKATSRAMRRS